MSFSLNSILARPGNLVFPANQALLSQADDNRVKVGRQPSGHAVAYGPAGRRILAVDPAGHPLHECEWSTGSDGSVHLVRARVWLDWDQWIGIKPQGLVNRTILDLSRKPGWQRLSADDLREMASRAMGVPLSEVKFFYTDHDLVIDAKGLATIRHAKDALYVLDEGKFDAAPERVRFMACMGAMHWADIDFLPVVELFQSLLPGTGSAVFELIRGLYDDQNQGRTPRALRYRGIPPYPSEAAYKLFSTFFVPRAPAGADPLPIFMDERRAQEVTWLPRPDPPLRYVDEERGLCVTVQGGAFQKATLTTDSAGMSFLNAGGFAPCGRTAGATDGRLVLVEGERKQVLPLRPEWNVTKDSAGKGGLVAGPEWRALFEPDPPIVQAHEAYSAVLLYPEGATEIEETATQPFVADYLEDRRETTSELAATVARSERVLIDGFDASVTVLLSLDRPRDYLVLFDRPAVAQKQAQTVWNQLARINQLSWVQRIRFVRRTEQRAATYREQYDLAYVWMPFAQWGASGLLRLAQQIGAALKIGGLAFVVGPMELGPILRAAGLHSEGLQLVESLPTVSMLRSILPQARVKPGLTLYQVRRR